MARIIRDWSLGSLAGWRERAAERRLGGTLHHPNRVLQGFLQGFVGRLFREFGIVVAGAVLISAFVSLTLTPVLNVKLTKDVHKHSWFYKKTEPFFQWTYWQFRIVWRTHSRGFYRANF